MKNKDYSDWSRKELVKEIKKLEKRKKYGLVWDEERTKEKFDKDSKGKIPIIKEVKSKEIKTDESKPTNILIEGDNYHALSVLNYTHKGKIDLIYIDPPYNTGNDFRYNDNLVKIDDSYRHSKWLDFMCKRLELAKTILKKSGVIFISIDDNEHAQLKLLCNQIFGENNFIANIIWQKKQSPQNDAKYFSDMHDFIVVFAKKKNIKNENNGWIRNLIRRTDKQLGDYKNPDNDKRGKWISADLSAKRLTPKDVYPIETPTGKIVYPPKGRSWVTSKEGIEKLIKDNRIWFGKNQSGVPRRKIFYSEVQKGIVPVTWWSRLFAGDNQESAQELKFIFDGKSVFETPKPTKLIKKILEIGAGKDALVLDFFAGAGTTGHAVMELNKEDGGNRKFILSTNNEGDICTDVCHPRIKKVIEGYTNEKEKVKGLGGNLRYFKTDFIDGEPTDKNKKNLVDQSTEMLCLKEDCFDEAERTETYSIFTNHEGKHLGIVYDDEGIEPMKKQIRLLNKKFIVYVFSLDTSARQEEFEEISEMVELRPIPDSILNVYKRIYDV